MEGHTNGTDNLEVISSNRASVHEHVLHHSTKAYNR